MERSSPGPHRYEQTAFPLLEQALRPNAVVRSGGPGGADATIELEGGLRIPIELDLWTPTASHDPDPRRVWVLPGAASGLRDRLRREGASYVDLRGAVFLSFPNLLVDRVNVKLPPARSGATRPCDPFADRASLVVRTLLDSRDQPERSWGVRELADAAGVGPATVTRVIRELKRRQVVRDRRAGRESEIRLTDARALFALWTGAYDWTQNRSLSVQAPVGDPLRFLRRFIDAVEVPRWALTLHSGASLVAPHATWERIHVYVDVQSPDVLPEIADRHGWPVGEDGRLVLMKPYYRDSAWHGAREIQGLPVVSDLQLALDLWHYPLRGREQAEHILGTQQLLGG